MTFLSKKKKENLSPIPIKNASYIFLLNLLKKIWYFRRKDWECTIASNYDVELRKDLGV